MEHGWTVKVSCFFGSFLLIFAAGTLSSAVFLSHKENVAKSEWPQATGHVQDCWVASFDPTIRIGRIDSGKSYSLLCGITYQLANHTYRETLHTKFTRSLEVRSAMDDWVARNTPEGDVTIRIDPKYPSRFFVQSPLPAHQNRDPADYVYAASVMAIVGLSLTAIGRKLIRAGR